MRNLWARHIGGRSRIPAGQKKSTATPTFKRFLSVGLAAAILAGCEGVPAFSFASLDVDSERGRIATQEVMLSDGLRVRAPFGKCVDTTRTRQSGGYATVVMANCSNLGGHSFVGARDAGLIFVTVIPGEHGDLSDLGSAVLSNPGVLARSGQGSDVEIISLKTSRSALYANLVDTSAGGPDGVSDRHWKAALDVAGRAIIISVFGKPDGQLPGAEGERLARDVAQSMIEANSGTPERLQSAIPLETVVETPSESAENTPQAVFERIFGQR